MTPFDKLQLHASVLELIAQRRSETGDENLGSVVEERILAQALRGIEEDILLHPGALEPYLRSRDSLVIFLNRVAAFIGKWNRQ